MRRDISVACFTGDSGLTDYSLSLARELNKTIPTEVVTGISLPKTFDSFGVPVRRFFRRSRWYPLDIVRFFAAVIAERPRALLFQAQLKVPLIEGLMVTVFRWLGIRCVLTVHDVLPHYPRPWSAAEFTWFYRRFDRLVVHSEAARSALERMGVQRPMLVVPHGVYDLFRLASPDKATARRRIGWTAPEAAFAVLFFGHLEPRKGLVEFLQAAEQMKDRDDVVFVVAGRFDARHHPAELAALVERLGRLPNVLLRNERIPFEEVENYFCACDLVAMPYHEGSTSGVLKLAIAFEKPVLASRVGDFPEQVPAGAGVWVDPGPQMAEGLARAVLSAKAEQAALEQAMRGAAAGCDWRDIAAKYAHFMLAPN
ncbi:glycosyltransferase [Paucibacter sp. M5-1]|uniref:glycosyltransferase n=1 Tax=Paucibacter sp. M5-1 TaxID=3015998 RepID=UPI0022B88A72|nr:glycosyltransferase [Paucibacter sp. M5-1]MCZ7879469.1 glycosyltransferase [Paucibacter sp. M5-1]